MDYIKYKKIEGLEDYILFTTGKIYSNKSHKFLKTSQTPKGYTLVFLQDKKLNKRKVFKLHRLLGLTFIPNPHNLPTIDHIDRNTTNNDLSNLRWASRRKQQINRNIVSRNTSGYTGVHFCSRNKYYKARITLPNKKRIGKSFSINKYGRDKALSLAVECRKLLEDKYYKNII